MKHNSILAVECDPPPALPDEGNATLENEKDGFVHVNDPPISPDDFVKSAGDNDSADNMEELSDFVDTTIPSDPVVTNPDGIIVWECSAAAKTFNSRGWSRSDDEWIRRTDAALLKPNSNLVRCAEDPKFRTRLCNHWDVSMGTFCPMRKKNK